MSLNKLDLGGKKAIVIIVLLLAALICATFFFGGDADKQTPVNKPEQENSEQIESSDSHLASDLSMRTRLRPRLPKSRSRKG